MLQGLKGVDITTSGLTFTTATTRGFNTIGYTNVANTPGSNDVTKFKDHSTYMQYNIGYNGAEGVNTCGYVASVEVDLAHNFMAKQRYFFATTFACNVF